MNFIEYNRGMSGFKNFLLKLGVFAALFIAVTGILGPWIIGTKLLYGFHFFIYANMGKMSLFSAIAFIILTRKHIREIENFAYQKSNILFVIFSIILIPIFFSLGKVLLLERSFTSNIPLSLVTHFVAILIPVLLLIGVFGIPFIKYFVKKFKQEILICAGLSVVFYFAIFQVWKLWPYFSGVVLKAVSFLLSLHVSPVREVAPLTLLVDDFAVRIEQACSGLDSILLFTALYTLIILVEWKDILKVRALLLYFPALLGLFLVNILRVYALILVGVYYDPKLTLQLFHTYLGMVLFMVYFYLFLSKKYKYLKK